MELINSLFKEKQFNKNSPERFYKKRAGELCNIGSGYPA
jgi:hypothetical protein